MGGCFMRRFSVALIAAVSTIVLTQLASAADLPRKAPAVTPPPPVYSWTGFYVGGNIGYGWAHADNDFAFAQDNTGGSFDTLNTSDASRFSGLIGGVQAGYNWQIQIICLRHRSRLAGLRPKESRVFNSTIVGPDGGFGPVINPVTTSYSNHLSWFGTVRGRLGTTIMTCSLVYATGGLAYSHVENKRHPYAGQSRSCNQNNGSAAWNASTTRAGWDGRSRCRKRDCWQLDLEDRVPLFGSGKSNRRMLRFLPGTVTALVGLATVRCHQLDRGQLRPDSDGQHCPLRHQLQICGD